MNGRFFVDANVFIYTRDLSEPDKQGRAAEWIEHLWKTRGGRISVQVLNEFFVTVTEKLDPGLDRERAWRSVRSLFAWKPIPVDVRVLEIAWSLVERYELSWWDSLIVAAAQLTDSAYLLSEDLQEGQRFGDLEVINPFAGRPDP